MSDPYAQTPQTGDQPTNQPAPDAGASKADWVEHAVAQGADREEAKKMTKEDLQARYPGQ